jgi:hypothetical protein
VDVHGRPIVEVVADLQLPVANGSGGPTHEVKPPHAGPWDRGRKFVARSEGNFADTIVQLSGKAELPPPSNWHQDTVDLRKAVEQRRQMSKLELEAKPHEASTLKGFPTQSCCKIGRSWRERFARSACNWGGICSNSREVSSLAQIWSPCIVVLGCEVLRMDFERTLQRTVLLLNESRSLWTHSQVVGDGLHLAGSQSSAMCRGSGREADNQQGPGITSIDNVDFNAAGRSEADETGVVSTDCCGLQRCGRVARISFVGELVKSLMLVGVRGPVDDLDAEIDKDIPGWRTPTD